MKPGFTSEERGIVAPSARKTPSMQTLVAFVSWAYLITNTLRIAFYAPQIRAVFRAGDGAASVSITTWGYWTIANLTAALYGSVVIHDLGFAAIFAGNFLCTALVTLVAAHKRLHFRSVSRKGVLP